MSPDLKPVEHRWDAAEREAHITDVQQLRHAIMSIRTINPRNVPISTNDYGSSGAAGGPTVSEKVLPNKMGFWWGSGDGSDAIKHHQKNLQFSVNVETVMPKVSMLVCMIP